MHIIQLNVLQRGEKKILRQTKNQVEHFMSNVQRSFGFIVYLHLCIPNDLCALINSFFNGER